MDTVLWGLLKAFIIGFAVAQLGTFVTTVYLHRAVTHRALTLAGPLNFVMRVLCWITTGIKPREWAAVHRRHHAFTDVEGDPHSPVLLGWKKVQAANVVMYRQVARDGETVQRYARDLQPDKWDRVLFDRALLGLGIGIAILVVTFGPWVGLAAAVFHTVLYLQLNSAINAVGHTFGKRPYDNTGTNLQGLALITGGEGLHNNHHAAPTSAKFALHRGEFDVSWPFIWTCSKIGLVKLRHTETKFKKPGDRSTDPDAVPTPSA